MSITSRSLLLTLSLFLFGACTSSDGPEASAQAVVEAVAAKHENIMRLTVHAIPAGETEYKFVASTLASKLDLPSDPEDLEAIQTGEVVVLEETDGIDVTVPICKRDGKHTAAAGVTMKASMGREAAITAATAIAAEIDSSWSGPAGE